MYEPIETLEELLKTLSSPGTSIIVKPVGNDHTEISSIEIYGTGTQVSSKAMSDAICRGALDIDRDGHFILSKTGEQIAENLK